MEIDPIKEDENEAALLENTARRVLQIFNQDSHSFFERAGDVLERAEEHDAAYYFRRVAIHLKEELKKTDQKYLPIDDASIANILGL